MTSCLNTRILNWIFSKSYLPNKVRIRMLNGGVILGEDINISHSVYFNGTKLNIGSHTWIGYGCYFSCRNESVSIGENCGIAAGVRFITDTHTVGLNTKRCGSNIDKPIIVEDGCWIGAGVIILPGVTIQKGCVIAAGSVVTKSCEANSLYAGNPAQKKKTYDDEKHKSIGDSPGI